MPRRGNRDKNRGRWLRAPDHLPKEEARDNEEGRREGVSGNYVDRKIIFKFFPRALIDVPVSSSLRAPSCFGSDQYFSSHNSA